MSRPSRGLVFKLASGLLLCVLGLLLLRLLIVGSVACTPPGHASLAASQHGGGDPIHIVYSLCGGDSKLEDLLVSLTSLYVMAQNDSAVYDVHVISDGSVGAQHFTRFARRPNFRVALHAPFPTSVTLFAPCSMERLYQHERKDFAAMDRTIYCDADSLWLSDAAALWAEFDTMEESVLFGMSIENEEPEGRCHWYSEVHLDGLPFYPKYGLNAGVLLSRLDRLRRSDFTEVREAIIEIWGPGGRGLLYLGDQDILNVHFHNAHAEQLRLLPCRYNWRDPCGCPEPVAVYHGNIDQRHREPDSKFAQHFATFAVINEQLEAHAASGIAT